MGRSERSPLKMWEPTRVGAPPQAFPVDRGVESLDRQVDTDADFGDQEYLSMCCVETANVGKRAVSLKPGESHMTSLEVRVRHRL